MVDSYLKRVIWGTDERTLSIRKSHLDYARNGDKKDTTWLKLLKQYVLEDLSITEIHALLERVW